VVGGQLVIELGEKAVVVVRAQYVGALLRQSEESLGDIDRVEVVEDDRGELVRLGAALPFIVSEEEGLGFPERPAYRRAKLVLSQHGIRPGQERLRIELIIQAEVIDRTAVAIRARLRDDIDEAAERAPVFGQEGGVEYAKFPHGFLRWSHARQPRGGLYIIGAVHQNQCAQFGLAAKSQPRPRRRSHARVRLLEGAAAGVLAARRHPASKLGEVHEVATDDWE